MARAIKRGIRSRYEKSLRIKMSERRELIIRTGPAHAVYFATYEVVKQAMGGNAAGHHPVAAGTLSLCHPAAISVY